MHVHRMKVRYLIFLCLLASCVSSQHEKEGFSSAYAAAVPSCELLLHPNEFVGHLVTVRARYANAPHSRVLFDPDCPSENLEIRILDSPEARKSDQEMQRLLRNYRTVGIRAVYSGLMKADQLIGGCSETHCFSYSLADAKLEAAEWKLR